MYAERPIPLACCESPRERPFMLSDSAIFEDFIQVVRCIVITKEKSKINCQLIRP